jgi:hypothetical protein
LYLSAESPVYRLNQLKQDLVCHKVTKLKYNQHKNKASTIKGRINNIFIENKQNLKLIDFDFFCFGVMYSDR